MRHFPSTPTQSFFLISIFIIGIIAGVGIPLGLTGTHSQPSWVPQGSGINMPSPSANVFRPEMVIITSDALKSTFEPLAQWKTQKGTPCIIKTTEEIYVQYPGRDHPEQIRNYLKDLYANGSLKWVLLGGDDNVVPLRYVFNDDTIHWGGQEEGGSDTLKPTDLYYSDLSGTWDADGDGKFGESPSNSQTGVDEVNWTPQVYVGRFPANDQSELQNLVVKTIDYEKNPLNGTWMNNFLLGGAVADTTPYNDEGLLVQNITASYVPSSMDITLRLDSAGNLTGSEQFKNSFDSGESLIHFQGHGSDTVLAGSYGTIFTIGDAYSLNNYNEPSFMFAAACSTGAFDITSSDTLMQALLFQQHTGVIGYIGAMRVDWYFNYVDEDKTHNRFNSLNRGMARYFWQDFFASSLHQPGKALADMKVTYLHSQWYTSGVGNIDDEYERKNMFTYTLWGDPELSVYTSQLSAFANPLPSTLYAGERLQATLKYNNSQYVVPGATVCIQSGNDFYYTSHVTGGAFDVRLALDPRTYNVTITGPNMQPYNTTFTTVLDTTAPQVLDVEQVPPSPEVAPRYSVDDAFTFALHATDAESGIGAVVLHVSYDNFATCANFSLQREGHTDRYSTTLYNFPPGNLHFYYTVIDYAENGTDVIPAFQNSLSIDPLISHYGIMATGIIVATVMGAIVGVSLVRKWRMWKQVYAHKDREFELPKMMENEKDKEIDWFDSV